MYYVYIIENQTKDFHYVGLTHNLDKRLKEHIDGLAPVTKGYLPLQCIWYCVFENKIKAASFEKYLKSGSGRAFTSRHIL